ncbi:Integrator complex subunit [Dirofilaria immitis]
MYISSGFHDVNDLSQIDFETSMNKQGHKTRANLPAGGFLAIGRDVPSTSDTGRTKPQVHKRELPQLSSGVLKKPRLDFSGKIFSNTPSTSSVKRAEVDDSRWRSFCAEVQIEPKQLLILLESAKEKQKPQKAARLICAAIREMIDHRKETGSWADEPIICSALMLFVKMNTSFLLSHEELIEVLCSLLSTNFPTVSPGSTMAPLLLYKLLMGTTDWNWRLVESFIDDSLHERQWTDRPSADGLIVNIMTAFGTWIPHESMYVACDLTYPERYRSTTALNRFAKVTDKEQKIDVFIMQMRDICERKGESAPRNLLKTMCSCAGNGTIRLLAARKMDSWLLNGKLQRYAMELLLWIASNIGRSELTEEDNETLSALLKLRALKSKQINILFNVALKEILSNDKEIICAIAKLLLSNEFSTNRFPYNMTMIHSLFTFDNCSASKVIAREITQMLAAKEEYLRISRTFLREFVRSVLRMDFDFALFTSHLFNASTEDFSAFATPTFFFKSLIDFCVMLPFLAITPTVREASQYRRNANGSLTQAHIDALQKFYADLRNFFEICTCFFRNHYEFCTDNRLFVYSYYRVLYLAPAEYYANIDQWPIEADVTQYIRVISDVPISEQLLCTILDAGSDPLVPIDATDTVDVIENLTKRASLSSTLTGDSMVPISTCDLLETIFKITEYKPPPTFNIQDEDLPPLAVRTLYWKAWLISLMWTSLNTDTLVKEVYYKYPNLKLIMQIVLTWDYSFPPMASIGDQACAEKLIEDDEKAAYEEKMTIKILEARLAGMEVSDSDSKLLNKLCSLDINGVCRRPPDNIMRDLEKLNEDLDLSRLLSECRDPDLLADIVRSQASSKALPSIINLVESNSNAITHLPLECICELFLHYIASSSSSYSSTIPNTERLNAMRQRLRNAITNPSATKASVLETLEYLAAHLAAHSVSERCAAAHSLVLLLDHETNTQILPVTANAAPAGSLHKIAYFSELKHRICVLLSQACSVETDLNRLSDYLTFLFEYADSKNLHLVAHYISNMVERLKDGTETDIIRINAISFYERYFKEVEQNEAEWTKELEVLLPPNVKKVTVCVEKPNTKESLLTMISTAVSGMLQLLCSQWKKKDKLATRVLMDLWFPISGSRPKVLNADGDGVELLPTWLKLKMLRTEDDRIIRVAMDDVKIKDALKFVQSFALTSYSCTKLLAILDTDETPLEGDLLEEAQKASMFVRSYKLRNAKGGGKFLKRVAEAKTRQECVKMEVDESDVHITLDSAPKIFDADDVDVKRITFHHMSIEEVISCIEQAVQEDREPEKWSSAIFELSNNLEYSRAVISLLKAKPIILSNAAIAIPLLISLVISRNKDTSLISDFDSLFNSVISRSNLYIPESVRRILYSRGGEYAIETESPCSPNYDTYDPESILMRLSNSVGMDDMQSRLMERFLDTCPEILPCKDNGNLNSKSHTILEILFSSRAPTLQYIISLLPTACSSSTLNKIIEYLLESHRSQFAGMSVLRTVISAFYASKTYVLSIEQCNVFIQYALAEMECHPDDVIALLMKFLENNANIQRNVTQRLIAQVSNVLSSPGNIQRKRFARQIADAFMKRFPDARLKNDTIMIDSYRSVCIQDRTVHNAIVELFSAAAMPSCSIDHKISTLAQIALSQPCVVLRHLPLLSACLASVSQLPARQLRTNNYQSLLQYIPKLLLDLAPQSFQEADRLQAILQTYFTLFENVGCGRTWVPLAQILQNVCVTYLELNAKSAKAYFLTQIEAIKQLCLCLKSPSSKILIDTIMCLNRIEE